MVAKHACGRGVQRRLVGQLMRPSALSAERRLRPIRALSPYARVPPPRLPGLNWGAT
jgi:hypothetical protein